MNRSVTRRDGAADINECGEFSLHVLQARGEVSIDVFSCKEYDPIQVCDEMIAAFGLKEVETCVLRRGLEYGNETTMLPGQMAHEVTAYTPNVSQAEEPMLALSGYHSNGYESNGTPLN